MRDKSPGRHWQVVSHYHRAVNHLQPGFFGPVPGSLLAQIGRGYTDLCAALCAVGVQAKELQVWKEVDGIFTADPRKVPSARLVPVITPDEAAELTYYGSEVIHPFTMEQVIRARIPIRIKNVENPQGSGTIIYPDESFPRGIAEHPSEAAQKTFVEEERAKQEGRMPTAVTIKDGIIVLNIHSNRKTISHGFLARIFGTLDRAGVVVDLISTSEVHVSWSLMQTNPLPPELIPGVDGDAGLWRPKTARQARQRARKHRRRDSLQRHGDLVPRRA